MVFRKIHLVVFIIIIVIMLFLIGSYFVENQDWHTKILETRIIWNYDYYIDSNSIDTI